MKRPKYVKGRKYVRWRLFRTPRRIISRLLLLLFIISVLFAGIIGYKVFPTFEEWYKDSVAIAKDSKYSDFENSQTSYIYDDSGTVLLKLKQDRDVQYIKYDDLPEGVIHAFVAIEDKRFYEHSGVDWASTAKAAILLVTQHGEVTRGGSTITQQLARNIYLSFETSYERKFREIVLALELEKKYTKEEILEFYINNINFGNGYYGIGAAANGYFGRPVNELSYTEIAFLCAIPNNPTYYDPLTNFNHTITRRNLILEQMCLQGYLTEKEYLVACNSACHVHEVKQIYNDYAASYALECTIREFMKNDGFIFRSEFESMDDYEKYLAEYAVAYDDAKYRLSTGGYKIKTSINLKAQRKLQKVLNSQLSEFKEKNEQGIPIIQGAATVVDNETGLVIASIGGRTTGKNNSYLALNRAFQSYKQPGSTIKPLIVYTPSLEREYTADSIVHDVPLEDGPKNSGDVYLGEITLRTAVEKSKNVVAWQLFEELSPKVGLSYLQNMNFSKIVPNDYYLPASLGGLTYGVTTEEMAGAYSALYNDGYWKQPTCIVSIRNSDGVEIYYGEAKKRVYKASASWDMVNILSGVSLEGTARGLELENGQSFACKTGTTNNNKAAWFCGFTPQYSIAVYVGADDNSIKVSNLWGGTYPAQIWKGMQDVLLAGKKPVALQGKRPGKRKSIKEVETETEESIVHVDDSKDATESTGDVVNQDVIELESSDDNDTEHKDSMDTEDKDSDSVDVPDTEIIDDADAVEEETTVEPGESEDSFEDNSVEQGTVDSTENQDDINSLPEDVDEEDEESTDSSGSNSVNKNNTVTITDTSTF